MVVGTPCPPISGLTFVKGEPIAPGSPGQGVVVLELWAPWCGPCIQSIPHLTELQKKLKGSATIVGVTSESDVEKIKEFVAKRGAAMDYTVAVDTRGATAALQQSANVAGIPHAFVIDDRGIITYSGHPLKPEFMTKLTEAVEEAQKPQVAIPPITQSHAELMQLSIKELKAMATERNLSLAGALEKTDIAQLLIDKASKVTYYRPG